LHFKRVGKLWSVRVGIGYRALAAKATMGRFGSGSARTRNMTGSSGLESDATAQIQNQVLQGTFAVRRSCGRILYL
jgi:hypothetical protein